MKPMNKFSKNNSYKKRKSQHISQRLFIKNKRKTRYFSKNQSLYFSLLYLSTVVALRDVEINIQIKF